MAKGTLRWLLALTLIMAVTLGLAAPSVAVGNVEANGSGRYIVIFNARVSDAAKDVLTRQFGGVVEKPIALLGNANVVFLPEQAVQALLRSGQVLRVEEDVVVSAVGKPQPAPPPAETVPWGVHRINADLVWGSNTNTGTGVSVAIIDTGIDQDHPDLAANIKGGQNFVVIRGRIDPTKWDDDNGHGTHVAGIIAGVDNEIGVIGVAPGASLYAVKVLNSSGSGYVSDIILGIQWAITNGMQVINMSLGSSSDVSSLHTACDAAYAAGIVVVAAAGNSGDTNPDNDVIYPARYDSVIAVAATDGNNTRASWSSDGPEVSVAAPGVSIYSTYKGGGYASLSGTSMASPHVAGTVALMLKANVAPARVREKLQTTALDLGAAGSDNYYGWGLVDAYKATY